MRSFLAALILLTGLGYAQQGDQAERKAPPDDHSATPGDHSGKNGPTAVLRRLEAVTWDPLESKLIWCISVWDLGSDMTTPAALERYAIQVNQGIMEREGEQRPFAVPGADLHALMDVVSTYAMRSTVWWEHGGADGQKAPDLAPGTTKDKTKGSGTDDKPTRPPAGKAIAASQDPDESKQVSGNPVSIAH